jgi:acetylornithine deacetylase/succinyl-diaminopimelate desuccinylase-like protein
MVLTMEKLAPDFKQKVKKLTQQVDSARFQNTLENLVQIPSPPGEEGEIAQWIASRLKEIACYDVVVDEGQNVIGRLGNGPRKLLIIQHTDTLRPGPLMQEPFKPVNQRA